MIQQRNEEEYSVVLLVALFKSLGESVRIELSPLYSDEGEPLDLGWVYLEGGLQTLFGRYGQIQSLISEFTEMIQEAEAMLPDFDEMAEEEKISSINEIFSWLANQE